MPLLDVVDVLQDPDFCETVAVTRSTQTGVVDAEAQFSTASFTLTAVVQPANSRDLERLLDAGREGGGITVWAAVTPAMRASGTPPLQTADVVAWRGADYTVVGTDDWSDFGTGYVKAVASKSSLP